MTPCHHHGPLSANTGPERNYSTNHLYLLNITFPVETGIRISGVNMGQHVHIESTMLRRKMLCPNCQETSVSRFFLAEEVHRYCRSARSARSRAAGANCGHSQQRFPGLTKVEALGQDDRQAAIAVEWHGRRLGVTQERAPKWSREKD